MSEVELANLHAEIEAFLQRVAPRPGETPTQDWSFWRERPIITAAEMEMLAWLRDAPATVAAVACHLHRDEAAAQTLLDALTSIGMVERDGNRYRVTDSTRLYLRLHMGDTKS